MADNIYFAAEPTEEVGDCIIEKVKNYYQFLQQSNKLDLYSKSYRQYYGGAMQGSQVNFSGEKGELVAITVNDYRNLLKNLHTLITSNRPAYECRASNTDHKSQAQCILGRGLVDYYLREKRLEYFLKLATEIALIFGEGFVSVTWNATLGEEYGRDPETGAVIYQGDIDYNALTPLDYVRDFLKPSPMNDRWGITISWQNKFELAAKYTEFADQIISMSQDTEVFEGYDIIIDQRRTIFGGEFDTDDLPVFDFYHKPTPAVPQGRAVTCLQDGTVLLDGPAPYRDVPTYRVACSEWISSCFGYSTGFDILPVQEMSDALHSTICTNQNAFGVQNIYCKSALNPSNISGGLRVLEGPDQPIPLQLTQTAPETFQYLQALTKIKETLAGINSVARGNPEHQMSGSAMALLQSTAIQFSMDLQQSYARLLEDAGTATLDRLRVFASVPRVAAIAGKSNRQYMKEFVGDDISEVNRVLVDVGNPIMNTTAGKADLAKDLLTSGLVKTPEEYIMVYTTGQLEPLYENQQSELMLIREENEMLSEGKIPPVLLTDNPVLHIKEHSVVANSPESRNDPNVMNAYTSHVQEHINMWKGTVDPMTGQFIPGIDPDLAQMLGIPVPPSLMAPGMLPPEQGGPPALPPSMNPNPAEPQAPQSAAAQEAGVKAPKLPKPPAGSGAKGTEMMQQGGLVQ